MNTSRWLASYAAVLLALGGSNALAQTPNIWPEQPITLVVPFAAGGGTDSIAREFAAELGQALGQTIVVENRGGGGGSIGAARVAQARKDGYTLLFATSTFATNAAWEQSKLYDPIKDFTPIAQLGSGPLMLVVDKSLGLNTVGELIEKAKSDPGGVNYCSAGPGSIN
ncbi:MAG: Bug family tripartite tricarboxylate transporter substrate binding protein, partial [Advenella sp.]